MVRRSTSAEGEHRDDLTVSFGQLASGAVPRKSTQLQLVSA